MSNKIFHEGLTFIDIDLDTIINRLRVEIEKRKQIVTLIMIQRNNYENSTKSYSNNNWVVTVSLEPDLHIVADKQLLHEALNEVLEQVGKLPDIEAILGFTDHRIV